MCKVPNSHVASVFVNSWKQGGCTHRLCIVLYLHSPASNSKTTENRECDHTHFCLRMSFLVSSQIFAVSSWDTVYINVLRNLITKRLCHFRALHKAGGEEGGEERSHCSPA